MKTSIEVIAAALEQAFSGPDTETYPFHSLAESIWKTLLKKSDIFVMQEMVEKDMKIGMFPTFIRSDLVPSKGGGTITMGVPNPVFMDFALKNEYSPILYLINIDEYKALKPK